MAVENKHNWRKVALWLSLWGVGIVFPLLITIKLFTSFKDSLILEQQLNAENQSKELRAKLEELLDPVFIFTQIFKKYEKIGSAFLKKRLKQGDFKSAHALQFKKLFLKSPYIPNDSIFVWYDNNFNVISEDNTKPFPASRGWKKFGQAIFNDAPKDGNEDPIAKRHLLYSFGSLYNLNQFRKLDQKAWDIYFGSFRHILGKLKFSYGSQTASKNAYLIILIPYSSLPPNWMIRYAIKKLSSHDQCVGSFRRSTDSGLGGGMLNSGFLKGLTDRWEAGNGKYHDLGWYYEGQPWSKDQDVILFTGIRSLDDSWQIYFLKSTPFICYLSIIISFVFFLAIGLGKFSLSLSLNTKFRLATFLLVFFPLFFVLIMVFDNLSVFETLFRIGRIQELESCLDKLDQEILLKTDSLADNLNRLLEKHTSAKDINYIKKLFLGLQRFGLEKGIFVAKDKECLSFGFEKGENPKTTAFILTIFQEVLTNLGFKVPSGVFPTKKSIEGETFFKQVIGPNIFEGIFGKFYSIAIGELKRCYFFTIDADFPNKATKFLGMFFNQTMMKRQFLMFARRELNQPNRKIVLPFIDKKQPQWILELAKRVEKTGHKVVKTISRQTNHFLVMARLLRNVETVGMAIIPLSDPGGLKPQILIILIIIFVLSVFIAFLVSYNLQKIFLVPVLQLTQEVAVVEAGKYDYLPKITTSDEIGILTNNFSVLVKGLQEKARMTPFLSRELVEGISKNLSPQVERVTVAVFFAGIRGFSRLESELPLEDSLALMNHFLGFCEKAVRAEHGEIDKFIGDTAMAVFKSDKPYKAAQMAIHAALNLREKMQTWLYERAQKNQKLLRYGVGIAVGKVVAGCIGSLKRRLDFTVIGDPVNLAARLEKIAGTENHSDILIAIDANIVSKLDLKPVRSKIETVKGRHGTVEVYEIPWSKGSS